MNVVVNHRTVEVPEGAVLADVLASQGISPAGTAVAIGGSVVPRDRWGATVLSEGVRITVIRAVCGG